MINFRSGTLTDLIRSAPSLPLWKCFGYFVLVAFGIELLVGVLNVYVYFCFSAPIQHFCSWPPHTEHITNCSQCIGLTIYLCCPQVVSFFHRAMLTVGLAVLSLWPFLTGLSGKAKVTAPPIMAPAVTGHWEKCEYFYRK